MKFSDHVDRERSTSIEYFGYSRATTKERLEVSATQSAALHVVQQRINRIRRFDGIFYYSAVSFSLAGILYSSRCHVLVKRYDSFTEYVQEGRGASHLRAYADELPRVPKEIHTLLLRTNLPDGYLSEREHTRDLADAFWALRNIANHSDRVWLVPTAAVRAGLWPTVHRHDSELRVRHPRDVLAGA